jgi:hypothetical protein
LQQDLSAGGNGPLVDRHRWSTGVGEGEISNEQGGGGGHGGKRFGTGLYSPLR